MDSIAYMAGNVLGIIIFVLVLGLIVLGLLWIGKKLWRGING